MKGDQYIEYLNHTFEDFQPENKNNINKSDNFSLEQERIKIYKENLGLFIIHSWRFSKIKGQVADVIINLHQHDVGPFTRDEIEKVRYTLGSKFFNKPQDRFNKKDNFKIEVSAYSPMLCLAEVFLRGKSQPIKLYRYIDFPVKKISD